MGEPASPSYALLFDVEVGFFGAMQKNVFKQHKQADLCGVLKDALEKIEGLQHPEIIPQLDNSIKPAHPEWFDDCKYRLAKFLLISLKPLQTNHNLFSWVGNISMFGSRLEVHSEIGIQDCVP